MAETIVCNTIREIIVSAKQRFGDGDAIRYKVGKNEIAAKSYTDLKQDSESFSRVLQSLDMLGKHIALTGATSYSWIVTYLGTVNSGSVAVPLDVSLPAEDLCELIDRADAEVFVCDEMRKDVMDMVKEKCPKLRYLISMQKKASDEEVPFLSLQKEASDEEVRSLYMQKTSPDEKILSLSQLLAENAGEWDFMPDPDALCTIMFTSGTTGKSKGVMLTQRNLANNATCLDMKIPARTVIMTVLPIHHAYCLSMDILKGLSLGSIICINDSLLRVAKNIKLFEPEMILMVPLMIETMAKKLEDSPQLPPAIVKSMVFGKQFHTICSGGAYLNPAYIDLFNKYGITILQGYGMTECAPVISTTVSWNIKKDAVGQLLPNCEAKIVDEEIWVRGSSVMMGYYKMPEETAETLEDGWLKTGDLGYVDDENFLYLTGRKKNLIITKNGENVSPEELENKLSESRLVQEILVREKDGLIEAEIYPDYEYAKKKKIKDFPAALQELIDDYNKGTPAHKKVHGLKVRETEFEKTTSRKIKRNQA